MENVAAGGQEAPQGCASHIAVVRQWLLCLLMSATLLSSSAVIAATLAAILDRMEGGGGAGFDHPSGECDYSKHSGWEPVIVVAATNCMDAIPSYLRQPGRLERREVVLRLPNSGGRY